MTKRQLKAEWIFLSEDEFERAEEWDATVRTDQAGRTARRPWAKAMTPIILAVVIVATAVAYLYREAQQGIAALAQDVQTAAQTDVWSQHSLAPLAAASVLDGNASPMVRWTIEEQQRQLSAAAQGTEPSAVVDPQTLLVRDDVAAAQVILSLADLPQAMPASFRQTRFYRATSQGWLRTDPVLTRNSR